MKRLFAVALVVAMVLSLASCSVKEAVQDRARGALGRASEGGNPGVPSGPGGTSPGTTRRPIATLPPNAGYLDAIENEWLNAPEEGYVWTITIKDVDEIDVMGLCTATYNVNLSASHIGNDMFGAYFGSFGFDYSADMGGLEALLTMQGGSVEYDTDGWFESDEFFFRLSPYDPTEQEMMDIIAGGGSQYDGMTEEERAYMEAILGQFYDLDNNKQFEKDGDPAAMWWDFDIPMTDGDMSGYFQMNGVLGGIVDGTSEVDETGQNVAADVRVAFGLYANGSLVYKFDERYSNTEKFENPLPYTIKVYPDNNVVMTFYSAQGGPVTTKCYGTIDKIPVGQTIVARP